VNASEQSELTGLVIGAAIEVHRVLGPGLLESIYQKSLEIEFKLRGILASAQARVPLKYKGYELGDDLVMDFCFRDRLVVELKAVSTIAPVHIAQTLSYMKLCNAPLGLLINFNVPILKDGIKRLAL
jgi:GxxExxY protein